MERALSLFESGDSRDRRSHLETAIAVEPRISSHLGGGTRPSRARAACPDTPLPAPLTDVVQFRGTEAYASWLSEDEGTVVDVLDGKLHTGSGQTINEPTLLVGHLDVQVDPATGAGSFTVLGATVPLEHGEFGIDDQLRTAFVTKDTTLDGATCTFPEGEECEFFTAHATVSVTWTGHDKIVPSVYFFQAIEDDFRYVFHAEGTFREATADGSITGDVDLIPGPAKFAAIGRTSSSDILWTRQN